MANSEMGLYSEDQLRNIKEMELVRLNYLHMGAALRGGFVTPELESMAKYLKEQEEIKAWDRRRKGPFTKRMWIHDRRQNCFTDVVVGLDSMATSPHNKSVCFVSRAFVEKYSLGPVQKVPDAVFETAGGEITCQEAVDVVWKGRDHIQRSDQWLILPKVSNIEIPLLGRQCMLEYCDLLQDHEAHGILVSCHTPTDQPATPRPNCYPPVRREPVVGTLMYSPCHSSTNPPTAPLLGPRKLTQPYQPGDDEKDEESRKQHEARHAATGTSRGAGSKTRTWRFPERKPAKSTDEHMQLKYKDASKMEKHTRLCNSKCPREDDDHHVHSESDSSPYKDKKKKDQNKPGSGGASPSRPQGQSSGSAVA
ncbi:hypothetical protein QBC35DRAFT_534608 [Podospora australis]|uniref:Uncharacterized protein n=1 Tax=Podospora australis TaxID=1536484 RepID=A0AAN6WN91_9PEZI|nr:hypothetical protein QBC35DRAFT_534608 [Podospora australis]